MSEFKCFECDRTAPHDHGYVYSPLGEQAPAIIYRAENPNAEVRDPETGEVIFPATKAPFRLIKGDRQ